MRGRQRNVASRPSSMIVRSILINFLPRLIPRAFCANIGTCKNGTAAVTSKSRSILTTRENDTRKSMPECAFRAGSQRTPSQHKRAVDTVPAVPVLIHDHSDCCIRSTCRRAVILGISEGQGTLAAARILMTQAGGSLDPVGSGE